MSPLSTLLRQTYHSPPVRFFIAAGKFLAAGHLCVSYLYSWGQVSGPSMLPGWEILGEGVVVSHTYRHGRGVQVGDVVRFKVPVSEAYAMKRVVGLPGDYVLVHTPDTGRDEMIQIPKGHCWVLGDNLFASKDSRTYGPLPMALIDGKMIWKTGEWPWQWNRIKKIKNPFEEQYNLSR